MSMQIVLLTETLDAVAQGPLPLPESWETITSPRLQDIPRACEYREPQLLSWQQAGDFVPVGDGSWTRQAIDRPQIREEMWERIKAERERRRVGGVLVAGKWFHSDDPSRIQHVGLVMMGANMPEGINWKTMDGSFVAMTPTLAGQIFSALATADMTNFSVAEQHRAAMMAAEVPGEYDYSGGWLETFA